MNQKTTLGRLPRDVIYPLELPLIAPGVLEGYAALLDLTGTISDAGKTSTAAHQPPIS